MSDSLAETNEHDVAIAETAADAAVAMAEVEAEARVAQTEAETAAAVAAVEATAAEEGELAQCRADLARVMQQLADLATAQATLRAEHQSIREEVARLIPPPQEPLPESPASPPESVAAEVAEAEAESPAEPARPERRRAHRWI